MAQKLGRRQARNSLETSNSCCPPHIQVHGHFPACTTRSCSQPGLPTKSRLQAWGESQAIRRDGVTLGTSSWAPLCSVNPALLQITACSRNWKQASSKHVSVKGSGKGDLPLGWANRTREQDLVAAQHLPSVGWIFKTAAVNAGKALNRPCLACPAGSRNYALHSEDES